MPTYRIVDLFAGAGGFSRGFVDTGHFTTVLGVEINADARTSYVLNFHAGDSSNTLTDVTKLTREDVPTFDVLVGGPPCQDFTQLATVRRERTRDRNDLLWNHYISLVHSLLPAVFVIENVPNLLADAAYEPQRQSLSTGLKGLGYEIAWGIVNTANYGLPQSRQRAFIIGSRIGTPYLPFPTLETLPSWAVIGDLAKTPTGDIPKKKAVFTIPTLHIGRNTEILSRLRYRYVLPLGNRLHIPEPITIKSWVGRKRDTTDSFGRIHPLQPSPTIRCEAYKPEKGRFLHPFEYRPLTLAEMARLQTFPDDHKFFGSFSSIGEQIGNAVPPVIAQQLAMAVFDLLQGTAADTVSFRPNSTEEQSAVQFRGKTASERVLNLLKDNLGRPVPWWQIENAARRKSSGAFVDWGTPLRQLTEQGYRIVAGNGTELLKGEYMLECDSPLPIMDQPTVRRLVAFPFVRQKLSALADDHLLGGTASNGQAVGNPPEENVTVKCAELQSYATEFGATEEEVYRWLAVYRHYPPVAPLLFVAAGVEGMFSPGPLPTEDPSLPASLVEPICNLCSCSVAGGLRPSLIRPVSAGGLRHRDNVWTLCSKCEEELQTSLIKIPSPASKKQPRTKGRKDKGKLVPLLDRFAEHGFLTPREAFYRNWLLLNRRNRLVIERVRRVLLTGTWKNDSERIFSSSSDS